MARTPLLIAIGGNVGTGKTTLAYGLRREIPELRDARIIENDEVRRELLGVGLEKTLEEKDYSKEISALVEREISKKTADFLSNKISVINPSGFFFENSRIAAQKDAEKNGAYFVGIWLTASRETMETRIRKRLSERALAKNLSVEKGHASDADEAVIDKFGEPVPPSSEKWKKIDASPDENGVLRKVMNALRQ